MTRTPTPDEIETLRDAIGLGAVADVLRLAREIAAHALCGPENWKPGVKAGMYEDIMRGLADTEALVQAAIAAIERTTALLGEVARRKAQIHHRIAAENSPFRKENIALSSAYVTIAEEVERYDHLRQPEKGSTDE